MQTKLGNDATAGASGAAGRTDRRVFETVPDDAGPRKTTLRGGVMYSVLSPGSHECLAKEHTAGILLAPLRKLRASLGSDKVKEFDAPAGCLSVVPAGVASSLTWTSTMEAAVVAIFPEALAELAAHESDIADVELVPPPFGTVDLWALSIAQRAASELAGAATSNELYLDSLVTLFGVHLLRTYTRRGKQSVPPKGGLSPNSARRVREYLSENFTQKVHVAELASVAGVSPNHFIVRFARTFGVPPHRYLINLRLDFAEKLLVDGKLPIAEVAHLTGFSDQSHLAVTMKRYRGRTPTELRFAK